MADISQIKLPDNNTYNFKDTLARGVKMYYGICTTAAATAAKVVTVGADQDFKLTVGALVMVKFTISNSASSVTLNVNSTGAKSIYYNNALYTGTSTTVCGYANAHLVYMYDGTNWVWVSHGADSNTTYSAMSVAEGQTGTATSSRSMRADYLKQIIQYHAVPSGQGVPAGGTAGQTLAKVDETDYNTEWVDPPVGIPSGGSTGQVLTKLGTDSYGFKTVTRRIFYGTCSTSASTATKVISASPWPTDIAASITPTAGDILVCRFNSANTATGAITLKVNGTEYALDSNTPAPLNGFVTFIYYGGKWVIDKPSTHFDSSTGVLYI